jgi:hypothetical protein
LNLREDEEFEEVANPIRLKDLVRPEDFAALPLLDLATAEFRWRFGSPWSFFGTYLDQPAYFEALRQDAVLITPSFNEHRFLVIELTDDQSIQAMQLQEQALRARHADEVRYSPSANEARIQARHLGESLGRQYRENVVLGWIDGIPNWPEHRTW